MTSKADPRRQIAPATRSGFTLIELVVAVTLLATFILPILHLIGESRVRAIRYTIARQVRDLAQQKLHDVVHYYETELQGTFEDEGKPRWRWEVDEPEMRSQGAQVILTYTIRVTIPQRMDGGAGGTAATASARSGGAEGELSSWSGLAGQGSTYEYTVWAFPDERWYEEQAYLYEQGRYSLLYGDPNLQGAAGALPGGRR